MREGFWRGVITGSIIGAAISMMAAGKQVNSSRQAGSRARRMLKGVSKTVNNLIK